MWYLGDRVFKRFQICLRHGLRVRFFLRLMLLVDYCLDPSPAFICNRQSFSDVCSPSSTSALLEILLHLSDGFFPFPQGTLL